MSTETLDLQDSLFELENTAKSDVGHRAGQHATSLLVERPSETLKAVPEDTESEYQRRFDEISDYADKRGLSISDAASALGIESPANNLQTLHPDVSKTKPTRLHRSRDRRISQSGRDATAAICDLQNQAAQLWAAKGKVMPEEENLRIAAEYYSRLNR